jgi:hypothetical protein
MFMGLTEDERINVFAEPVAEVLKLMDLVSYCYGLLLTAAAAAATILLLLLLSALQCSVHTIAAARDY